MSTAQASGVIVGRIMSPSETAQRHANGKALARTNTAGLRKRAERPRRPGHELLHVRSLRVADLNLCCPRWLRVERLPKSPLVKLRHGARLQLHDEPDDDRVHDDRGEPNGVVIRQRHAGRRVGVDLNRK